MAWRAKRRAKRRAVQAAVDARRLRGRSTTTLPQVRPERSSENFIRLLGALALLRDHCLLPDGDDMQSGKRATRLKLSALADVAAMKAKVGRSPCCPNFVIQWSKNKSVMINSMQLIHRMHFRRMHQSPCNAECSRRGTTPPSTRRGTVQHPRQRRCCTRWTHWGRRARGSRWPAPG